MKRSNLLNILKENLNKLWSFLDCAFLHWFGSYKQPKTVLQVPCYKNRLPLFLHTTLFVCKLLTNIPSSAGMYLGITLKYSFTLAVNLYGYCIYICKRYRNSNKNVVALVKKFALLLFVYTCLYVYTKLTLGIHRYYKYVAL